MRASNATPRFSDGNGTAMSEDRGGKWWIVCKVCRKEKRVYSSACVNATTCDRCMAQNDNPELARLERLQESSR
jgi:hypothetical protein